MKPASLRITSILTGSLLLCGCLTLPARSQKKDLLLQEVNELSLQVHSLEQENRLLQQKSLEQSLKSERDIAQMKDEIADLKVKQQAQTKLLLKQMAEAQTAKPEIKLTNSNIQRALEAAGYNIGIVDGKIGPKTREAVLAFQQANDLPPNGIVKGATWAKLKGFLSERTEKK